MSDLTMRSLERSALSGSPSDQARALAARLRVAPGCEACGGTGKATSVGSGWKYEMGRYPNLDPSDAGVARIVPCPSCAGTGSPLRARVELAAYCGNEGARLALTPFPDARDVEGGRPTACNPCMAGDRRNYTFDSPGSWHCLRHATEHPDLAMWLSGLSRWSDIGPVPGWVMVRAAVAAARVALPSHLASEHGLAEDGSGRLYELDPGDWISRASLNDGMIHAVMAPRRAIEAAEAWTECPCGEGGECERRFLAASAAVHQDTVPHSHLYAWLPTGPWAHDPQHAHNREAPQHAARLSGESPVRAAICSSLVEWALGG